MTAVLGNGYTCQEILANNIGIMPLNSPGDSTLQWGAG